MKLRDLINENTLPKELKPMVDLSKKYPQLYMAKPKQTFQMFFIKLDDSEYYPDTAEYTYWFDENVWIIDYKKTTPTGNRGGRNYKTDDHNKVLKHMKTYIKRAKKAGL